MAAISMVEKVFADVKGAGGVKKTTVMTMAEQAAGIMAGISTGGQKETWTTLAPIVDQLVEAGVTIMNQTSQLVAGTDVIVTSN